MTSGRRQEEEEEEEGADTTLKTKTPHVNVGKNVSSPTNEFEAIQQNRCKWKAACTRVAASKRDLFKQANQNYHANNLEQMK